MSFGASTYAGPTPAGGATAGDFPAVALMVAFDSPPGAEEPVWTTVGVIDAAGKGGLRSFSVDRGRSRELDCFQAGRASFVLDNRDRRFDPDHAAGPYFGKVLPMKRVRLTATYGGVTYPLFDGYADSWDQSYVPPREAVCVLQATDGMKVLAAADLPTSAYAAEVLADGPVAWWRLGEAQDAVRALDAVGSNDLALTGAPTFGTEGLVSREPDTAATFTSAQGLKGERLPLTARPFTVEWLYNGTSGGSDISFWTYFTGDGRGFTITADPTRIDFDVATTAGGASTKAIAAWNALDNQTHHLAVVWEANGTQRIYVDGVERTTTPASNTGAGWAGAAGLFSIAKPFGYSTGGIPGTYDEIALYDTALSAARIAVHAAQVATPWNGDTPKARLTRLLDFADWPDALREIDAGTSTLQSADLSMSLLEHAQKVAGSEFGELFLTASGVVRLVGRQALVNRADSAIFGDGAGELDYTDITFDFSDQLIRNDVTVSRSEGIAQRVEDTDSIAAYTRHSYTRDGLIHDDDALSRGAAQLLVSLYAQPLDRVTSLDVAPRRDPSSLFPQVLARELLDELTVVRRPQGVGDPISRSSRIEGISHDVEASSKAWRTTWALSPTLTECYFELDDGTGSAPCGLGATSTDGPALYL